MADLGAVSGYVSLILAELVGTEGQVSAIHPCALTHVLQTACALEQCLRAFRAWITTVGLDKPVDGLWIGGLSLGASPI